MELEPAEVTQLTLASNQARVAKQVLASLGRFSPAKRGVVVIEALSGTGKSFVLSHLQAEASKKRFRINESPEGLGALLVNMKSDPDLAGVIVGLGPEKTAFVSSPLGSYRLNKEGFKVVTFLLPAMDKKQMEAFLSQNPSLFKPPNLLKENVVQYSLGIPLLAKQLSEKSTTEEEAAEIVAEYLYENVPGLVSMGDTRVLKDFGKKYLRMEIPPMVTNRLHYLIQEKRHKSYKEQIESYLKAVDARWKETAGNGNAEIPVIPKTEETIQMYALSLRNFPGPESPGEMRRIEILATNLPPSIFEKIQRSFGFKDGKYAFQTAARVKLFELNDNRLFLIAFSGDGDTYTYAGYRAKAVVKDAKKLEERSRAAGLISKEGPIENTFYIQCFNHATSPIDPTQAGLMMETLLQNLGVAYYTRNTFADREYGYLPQENRLTMPFVEQIRMLKTILFKYGLPGLEDELTRRGCDRESIKKYQAEDRSLLFGLPADVNFSSLQRTLKRKRRQETNEDGRQILLQQLKELIEWSPKATGFTGFSIRGTLERLQHETVESLRSALFDPQEEQGKNLLIARVLDLATDYMVLRKLITELKSMEP